MVSKRRRSQVVEDPQEALTYIRVSGKEQEKEGLSLPTQLADLRRYCAERGWGIEGEYRDVLKGTRDDRPQYQQMLSDVRRLRAEGRRPVVVVKWLHRLGRRMMESVRCRDEFKQLGVPIHSVMEGGEVDDLRANIMGSVAEYEVQQLGERVSEVVRHVQEAGWFKGGKASWGYRMRPATEMERKLSSPKGVLDVDEAAAPHVKELFQRAADGETIRSLSRWVASLPDEARAGKRLNYNAVRFILAAPVYISRQTFGAENALERPVCHWPALVEDDIWSKVQGRIASHAMLPRQASNKHLLTGIARCPVCGSRMVGESSKTQAGRYRCKSYLQGAGAAERKCNSTAHMPTVDGAVILEASQVLSAFTRADKAFLADLHTAWEDMQTPPGAADVQRRIRQLEAERDKAKQRLTAATLKLLDGTLDDAAYRAAKAAVEEQRDRAEAELRRLRGTVERRALPPLEVVLERIGGWDEALAKFDVAHQREILGELITRVVPHRVGRFQHDVRIEWTELGEALRQIAAAMPEGDARRGTRTRRTRLNK